MLPLESCRSQLHTRNASARLPVSSAAELNVCLLEADKTIFRDFLQIHCWAQSATASVSGLCLGFFFFGFCCGLTLGSVKEPKGLELGALEEPKGLELGALEEPKGL